MAENPPKLVECLVCKGTCWTPTWREHGQYTGAEHTKDGSRWYPCDECGGHGQTRESVAALIAWALQEQSDATD